MRFSTRTKSSADDSASQTSPVKNRRRGCTFGLTTLLTITFLIALALARVRNDAVRQRDTIQQLAEHRLEVTYDYEYHELGFRIQEATPSTPAWLIDAVGVDYFHNVVDINGFITDREVLPLIANLKHLRGELRLERDFIDIQDSDLGYVSHLDHLTRLRLSNNPISDDGLRQLVGLRELKWLSLHGTLITDDGCDALAAFANLELLHLSDTRITGAAIPHLLNMKGLEVLALNALPIEDDDVQKLTGFSRLETLGIGGTRITDRALEHVVKLKNIRMLELSDTEVTDAGIELLLDLPNLQHLYCIGTKVTVAGADRFRSMRPQCSAQFEELE